MLTKFINEVKEHKRRFLCSRQYRKYELDNPGEYYSLNAFDYYKCIFVHIPKAAGISVNMALFGNYIGAHRTIQNYQDIYPKNTFERYYKFTFVRNPWDRIYSAYNFLKKGGINRWDLDFMNKHLKNINSFEEFVNEWLNNETKYIYQHFKPQSDFLLDKKDNCPLDFIGRFENIESDFKFISNKINPKAKLIHLNPTFNSKSYKSIYTDEMIKKISEIYRKDIEFLGYNFD